MVWLIKHVISPIDRFVVRIGRGRIPPPTRLVVPSLLLTTVGRRSGAERTVPLIYLEDGGRFLVANARPAGERRNPWVLNLRDARRGRVRHSGRCFEVAARELDQCEIEEWWPEMVDVWPAFADHYASTGERTMFALEPIRDDEANREATWLEE